MKIKTEISYNLDLLCFLNIMTADDYYVKRHKEAFDKWYPKLSDTIKVKISEMIAKQGYSMLAPTFTLFISSLKDFNNRNLLEMLNNHCEIVSSMNNTQYIFELSRFEMYFSFFSETIVPLITELEKNGFYEFWKEFQLPLIKAKCLQVDNYMQDYKVDDLISQFRNFDSADCTVYMCSFANPHGIKLCGNKLISDVAYSTDTILSNVTHELFHPAFDFDIVKQSLQKLSEKSWVIDAFANQNPNSGYHSMDGFIEEHIVEALGIYVLVQLGIDIEPYEYFKTHDEGSHVLSPHFYKYLCENKKGHSQSFEDYFMKFADSLIK